MSKRTAALLLVVVGFVIAGLAFDRSRSTKRAWVAKQASTQPAIAKPSLPQWGALIPEADNVEVSGSAMCGYCTWRVGEPPDNLVLQMNQEPGVVFVAGNSQRDEIEKLTGKCSGGDYWITARGTVTQYDGHNYLLVKNFTAVKTK